MARPHRSRPKEVFLSHSSRNRRFASKLADLLRDHGIPVWYSVTDIKGAQQWHDEIGHALARCDWFVVVLSNDAVRSPWVKRELVYALNDSRFGDHIVPVLYRDCDTAKLSWTLQASQMIDFTGDFSIGCRELLRVWGLGLKDPQREKQDR